MSNRPPASTNEAELRLYVACDHNKVSTVIMFEKSLNTYWKLEYECKL